MSHKTEKYSLYWKKYLEKTTTFFKKNLFTIKIKPGHINPNHCVADHRIGFTCSLQISAEQEFTRLLWWFQTTAGRTKAVSWWNRCLRSLTAPSLILPRALHKSMILTRFIMDSTMHRVWRRRRQKLSIQVMKLSVKFQIGRKSFFYFAN